MKKGYKYRIVYHALIGYVLAAAVWWSFLLLNQNQQLRVAELRVLELEAVELRGMTKTAFLESAGYRDFQRKFSKQRKMIIGEGLVFFAVLLVGVWFLNRGFRKEVALAQQQRNFLLSITHELKSPIASIKLALDTFIKRPNLKPEQIQLLTKGALTETERLNDLVNNILLAARIENSFQILVEPLDLKTLIQENLQHLRTKFPNVRFSFDQKTETSLVQADRLGLNSIIVNLLENAVKYSPNGDTVGIELSEKGDNVLIEVKDEGIGISDENKARVFEKFFRVGSEDTRRTKGTGLGLYIVKMMVMAHKGNIQVLDNKPKGTIFRVSLPRG